MAAIFISGLHQPVHQATSNSLPMKCGINADVHNMRLAGSNRHDCVSNDLINALTDPAQIANLLTIFERSFSPRKIVDLFLDAHDQLDVTGTHRTV